MDAHEIRRINREAFEEVVPIHAASQWKKLVRRFRRPDYCHLTETRQQILLRHGLAGRAVVHPCCNNGRELLSIKRLGAGRCLGFDFTRGFIEQGRELAAIAGTEVELLQADVCDFPEGYDGQFDIGVVTPGSLRCLPEPRALFDLLHRLLRPDGWIFVDEMHPLVDVFGAEAWRRPRRMRFPYFDREPKRDTGGLDYFRTRRYRAKPYYRLHHTLSDLLQGCIDAGFRIETFEERVPDVSGGRYRRLEGRLPLSFLLTARPG